MKEDINEKSEKLRRAIFALDKPNLDSAKKSAIKSAVLSRIDGANLGETASEVRENGKLVSFIRFLRNGVSLDSLKKAFIKERVFSLIGERERKSFSFGYLFFVNRKSVSVFLVFLLCFGVVFFNGFEGGVVKAETITYISSFSGDVRVFRGDALLDVYEGMEIVESDKIITGENSIAEIIYFNDSVSRLAEDTAFVVDRLFAGNEVDRDSYVEVSVEQGKVWTKAINLFKENSLFVLRVKDVYLATARASFNVQCSNDEFKMEVFNHFVEFQGGNVESEKISSGQKILFNEEGAVQIESLSIGENDLVWVQDNLRGDFAHLEMIGARAEFGDDVLFRDNDVFVGVDADKIAISAIDDSYKYITFNDVKEKKIEIDIADKKFRESLGRLGVGDLSTEEKESIEKFLLDFSERLIGYYSFADEISLRDDNYGEDFRLYVDEKVLALKGEFGSEFFASSDYLGVGVFDDIHPSVENEVDLIEKRVYGLASKLVGVEQLMNDKNFTLATEIVDEVDLFLESSKDIVADGDLTGTVFSDDFDDVVKDVESVKVSLSQNSFVDSSSDGDSLSDDFLLEEDVKVKYGVEVVGDKALSPLLSDL